MNKRPTLVSHIHMAGNLKKKIADMKVIMESDEVQDALKQTADDIDNLWRKTIYDYFNATTEMPMLSYDEKVRVHNKMTLEHEWKTVQRFETRETSGQLGRACKVSVSERGRISVMMMPIYQWTSKKSRWLGADYGQFLRKGTAPGFGAFDPPSGKRMVSMDEGGTVWWACGMHPGVSDNRWKRFMNDFKRQYKVMVEKNMRRAIVKAVMT